MTHKLSKTLQDIQAEFFRVLKDSQTGTWENAGTQKNIKITKKPVKDNAMGYIKGEGMIIGFSPDEVMAVQAIVECKKICKLPEKQIIFFCCPSWHWHFFLSRGPNAWRCGVNWRLESYRGNRPRDHERTDGCFVSLLAYLFSTFSSSYITPLNIPPPS